MKTTRKVATLVATLITFGSLSGGANAALSLNFDETSGNTVVTLTAINLDLTGLTSFTGNLSISTLINPSSGNGLVAFTGSTDTSTRFETSYEIPTFTFGTGGNNTAATGLSASNPFIYIRGASGRLYVDNDNPLPANFTATATYSGSFVDNGIDSPDLNMTFSNGETFSITFIPEPSSALLLGLGVLGLVAHRRRFE